LGERDDRVSDSQPFVPGGLLTVSEVANAMRVSNMTVYRLIKSGELPAVRVGKNYRLRETDLERFLEERSVRTEGP
jgi:excisionase family DNA binding protein